MALCHVAVCLRYKKVKVTSISQKVEIREKSEKIKHSGLVFSSFLLYASSHNPLDLFCDLSEGPAGNHRAKAEEGKLPTEKQY